MGFARELKAAARLDVAEVMRSRWLIFCLVLYGLTAAFFVLVGMRESSVMGFTGMGRVLFSLMHALVLVLPLLALTATTQVVNRAREDGSLELLFSLPLRRGTWFLAVSLSRYLVLVAPLALLLVLLAAVGHLVFGQALSWAFVLRTIAVGAALLAAFTGVGLWVSTRVRNQSRATIVALVVWASGVALLDFALVGAMLQWRLNPQTVLLLGALNPVQAARLALVSGAEPDLTVLGPVGFFLAQKVGSSALFGIGTVWPALVGAVSWWLAARAFRRGDLV